MLSAPDAAFAPLPADGAVQNYDDTWKHMEYFLKEVIPVAEKSGVRMALHPNDPPAPSFIFVSLINPQGATENSIGVRQDPWQGPMVLATLWGASYTFIKLGVESIPPVTLIAGRTLIAGLLLVAVRRVRREVAGR